MIGNFPNKPLYNPGGYRSFQFIHLNEVSSYPLVQNGRSILPVGLKLFAMWLNGYSTYETIQFTEEPETIEHGTFYKPTVAGFMPGDSPEHVFLMQSMEQQPFLMLLTDARGFKRLIGTPANPLIFTAKFDGSLTRSGSKGYTFQFSANTFEIAPFYPF